MVFEPRRPSMDPAKVYMGVFSVGVVLACLILLVLAVLLAP